MRKTGMTATELSAAIRRGDIRVADAVTRALTEIRKKDGDIHAFLTVDEEGAMRKAEEIPTYQAESVDRL